MTKKRQDILSSFDGLISDLNSKAKLEIQSIEKSSSEQINLVKSQIIDLKNQKNNISSEIKNIGNQLNYLRLIKRN